MWNFLQNATLVKQDQKPPRAGVEPVYPFWGHRLGAFLTFVDGVQRGKVGPDGHYNHGQCEAQQLHNDISGGQ